MSLDDFMQQTAAVFTDLLGEDVVVKVNGVAVMTVKANVFRDVKEASPYGAEVVQTELFAEILEADYARFPEGFTLVRKGVEYSRFGKPAPTTPGHIKIKLVGA